MGFIPCSELARIRDGRKVAVSGLVLVRQRPGSANGVLFVTLEDESGIANVIVWKQIFERFRRIVLGTAMLGVRGQVQVEGEVIHVIADELIDHGDLLRSVGGRKKAVKMRTCWAEKTGMVATERSVPQAKEMFDPHLRPGSVIRPQTRDFR
ncbi:Error-prone repair-like protein of DNA polymerase III alpha subunit [Azospirillum argentinense]|uniref:OB domain-containing protein n=1 Tax=Azospirillum argentinense TaxID=2970906 RepID=A0A5B0KKI7_9PROT|nr:Error-prone repair-like protein of DNA polymerase III alpha subunit [Azospirillum argentinense]